MFEKALYSCRAFFHSPSLTSTAPFKAGYQACIRPVKDSKVRGFHVLEIAPTFSQHRLNELRLLFKPICVVWGRTGEEPIFIKYCG